MFIFMHGDIISCMKYLTLNSHSGKKQHNYLMGYIFQAKPCLGKSCSRNFDQDTTYNSLSNNL